MTIALVPKCDIFFLIVVHCSNGVGRSRTYVLIDMVLNRLSKGCNKIWNLCNIIFVTLTCFHLTNFLFHSCALQRRSPRPSLQMSSSTWFWIGLAHLDFTRKIARRLRTQTDTTRTGSQQDENSLRLHAAQFFSWNRVVTIWLRLHRQFSHRNFSHFTLEFVLDLVSLIL